MSRMRRKSDEFLRGKLERLKERHPVITDVRGRGLMIGVQIATPQLRDAIIERMLPPRTC